MPPSLPAAHPEWYDLLQLRDALHSQIAAVITERHALDDSNPVVVGRYAAAFGARLTRLHAAEIEAARLKREIELVQAAINSGRELDYGTIQESLEAEFAEWQAKLEQEADALIRQKNVLEHLLDPETARALRDRFRILARRLHPDLNPAQPPAAAELWHRVAAAYAAQDIAELDALEILSRDAAAVVPPDSIEAMRGILQKLRAQLDHLLTNMAVRRKVWPFDQLPVLDDPGAMAARQAELDARIGLAESLRDERKHWLNQLLDH